MCHSHQLLDLCFLVGSLTFLLKQHTRSLNMCCSHSLVIAFDYIVIIQTACPVLIKISKGIELNKTYFVI